MKLSELEARCRQLRLEVGDVDVISTCGKELTTVDTVEPRREFEGVLLNDSDLAAAYQLVWTGAPLEEQIDQHWNTGPEIQQCWGSREEFAESFAAPHHRVVRLLETWNTLRVVAVI